MPKLSVIVPVYNVQAYLPRCLEAILAQEGADFEVILVNDGTKDDSARIMEEYAARDGRIHCVHKENGGLSSARNAGMDVASGEYFMFLDSDDWINPGLFHAAITAAEQTGATQVIWNYARVWDDHREGAYLPLEEGVVDVERMGLARYFYKYFMPYKHGQEAWSKLYRREVITKNALRFMPNDEIFAEDTLFSAMYLLHTRRIAVLKEPYVNYYQRGDSLMGQKKPRLCARLINLSVCFADYAKACGKEKALKNVLPVFAYDKLWTKGIRLDPSFKEAEAAMAAALEEETLRKLLEDLHGILPLAAYTLHTGKGFATQVRARLFAARWLRGDVQGAAALVSGRIGRA